MNENVKLDKKKECATADIHSLSHDGRGIAVVNHKTVFVEGALPEEKVTYTVTQKRSHYQNAIVQEIIHPSSERVVPPCQHFGVCGGCNLQHMKMEKQLQFKQETLLDQLKRFGNVEPENVLPPLQANSLGYRRKARLGVKFVIKKNKLLVGFREKSSRYLADLDRCLVLHPRIGLHLKELSELIASLEQYQHIPQVEVAIGDEEVALVFRHLEKLSDDDKKKLIQFGEHHHIHIYLQPNSPDKVNKIWPCDEMDRLRYTLPLYQLEYLFHPLDFTQINLEMNRLMVQQAISLLDLQSDDHVLDLFCGIGNFTLPIAQRVKQVTGIEGSAEMIARSQQNALHNGIHNVTFRVANLMESLVDMSWIACRYQKILLDPPRAGAKEILPYFARFDAEKIVYVSCHPSTLARDVGELVHHYGYQLKTVGMMNMFPHTAHIEAIALLTKG